MKIVQADNKKHIPCKSLKCLHEFFFTKGTFQRGNIYFEGNPYESVYLNDLKGTVILNVIIILANEVIG